MTKEYWYQKIPSMGEGIQEVTIVKWLKKPGDKVEADDPLLEVSTDKVDTEISATSAGFVIAHFAEEGETVAVEQQVAQLALEADCEVRVPVAEGLKNPNNVPTEKQSNQAFESPREDRSYTPNHNGSLRAQLSTHAGQMRTSPLVRKIANELGIKLHELEGTGLSGRITRRDLERYLQKHEVSADAQHEEALSHGVARMTTFDKDGAEQLDGVPVRRVKMTPIRKITATHMVESVRTSPHVTTTFEMCLDNILQMKSKLEEDFKKTQGHKLTLTPFLIHAAALALKSSLR